MSEVQDLSTILYDKNAGSYKRRDAFTKLTRANPPELVDILTRAVEPDGDRYLTQDIIKYLTTCNSPQCYDAFKVGLSNDDSYVKTYALRGLGDCGDPRAIDLIKPFLDDRSYSIKSVAEEAVETLGGLSATTTSVDAGELETIPEVPASAPEPVVTPDDDPVPDDAMSATTPEPASTGSTDSPKAQDVEPETEEGSAKVSQPPVGIPEVNAIVETKPPVSDLKEPGQPELLNTTPLRTFFSNEWDDVESLYQTFWATASEIPRQEQRSLDGMQQLTSYHADKDDDIAELDKEINALKRQITKQRSTIDELSRKIDGIRQQQVSPLTGIVNVFVNKKEALERELDSHETNRKRYRRRSEKTKKELQNRLKERATLTAKLEKLETTNSLHSTTFESTLATRSERNQALDAWYERLMKQLPLEELTKRLRHTLGRDDDLPFLSRCISEFKEEVVELERNKHLLSLCRENAASEQELCHATTNRLGKTIGSGFKVTSNEVDLNFNIYGQLNFEEESTFWGGFSNAEGRASGSGKARARFKSQEVQWEAQEAFDDDINRFAESWENLGKMTARSELIQSMVNAGQHTINDYVRLIRHEVEGAGGGKPE